jgi:hypothetical protein
MLTKKIVFYSIFSTFLVLFFLTITDLLTNEESIIFYEEKIEYFGLKSDCACKDNAKLTILKFPKNQKQDKVEKSYVSDNILFDYQDITSLNFTCNIYSELRRGSKQKVIGFSLYGKDKAYYKKLKNITLSVKKLYPDWLIRIYHDSSIDNDIKCEIECQIDNETNKIIDNTDFCNVEETYFNLENYISNTTFDLRYVNAMMWRWFPLFDDHVDIFSSRDSDSYILQREVDSVNVWLESENIGHIMRGEFSYIKIKAYYNKKFGNFRPSTSPHADAWRYSTRFKTLNE